MRITITEHPSEAVSGGFIDTGEWASMGESREVLAERVRLLAPYRVNADLMRIARNPLREVHALPARLPRRRQDYLPAQSIHHLRGEVISAGRRQDQMGGKAP